LFVCAKIDDEMGIDIVCIVFQVSAIRIQKVADAIEYVHRLEARDYEIQWQYFSGRSNTIGHI